MKFSIVRSAISIERAAPSISMIVSPVFTRAPSGARIVNTKSGIDHRASEDRRVEAGDNASFTRAQRPAALRLRIDQRVGRDIAGHAEIFGERELHDRLKHDVRKRRQLARTCDAIPRDEGALRCRDIGIIAPEVRAPALVSGERGGEYEFCCDKRIGLAMAFAERVNVGEGAFESGAVSDDRWRPLP